VPVVGSRFLIEAGFIIAVAVVAGLERLGTWWIIVVVAAAWLAVAAVEIVVWLRQVAARQSGTRPRPDEEVAVPPPAPAVVAQAQAITEAAPEPEPAWKRPRLASVPPASPAPEPEPEPEPVPVPVAVEETASVIAFTPSRDASPREWNLWELERAARDHSEDDVARAEERSYLLMYLREFAGPDGVLPADFDGLVRDAFGDVLHAAGA
jgi:hypothetical protein